MTQTITGTIELPSGGFPAFGKVEFTLSSFDLDPDAVIVPRTVSAEISSINGTFSVNLWPNDVGSRGTFYRVSVIEYQGFPYTKEASRIAIGNIQVLDTPGQVLQELLDGFTFEVPVAAAVLFVYDNAGVDELRVRFSNGVEKTLANWS